MMLSFAKLLKKGINISKFSALLTVSRNNVYSLIQIIDHYVEVGFSSIFLRPLNLVGRAEESRNILEMPVEDFVSAYKEAFLYIMGINIQGIHFVESYADIVFRSILTPFSTGFADIQSPSGMSTIALAYETSGEIYACDEGRMLSYEGNKTFKISNINSPYSDLENNYQRLRIIEDSIVELIPGCYSCPYSPYCGPNIVANHKATGTFSKYQYGSPDCTLKLELFDFFFSEIIPNNEYLNVVRQWQSMN